MNSVSDKVNLISFGNETQTSAVKKSLIGLGTSVKSISRQYWLNDCYSNSYNPSVLVLGNNNSFHKKIISTISKSDTLPCLAVYSYPVSKHVKNILSSCEECCGWPCESQELNFRLERLLLAINSRTNFLSNESSSAWVNLNLVGSSPIFQKTLDIVKKCAHCEAPVIIEGETGSGKEMVARAIHYLGTRRDYPFIPVNCGAIPDHLVENELFGHEKGAYTDAKQNQSGVISQADGGTLFLDEIEVLSEKGQVSLLRFIEDHNIKPLGAKQCKKVNVRIIAASNTPLSSLVEKGQFRQDLLFRLNLLSFRLPPLRERISDIECLADYFMKKYQQQYQQTDKQLSPDFIKWMKHYDWPGNVRELENYIHRQFLLTDETWITHTNYKDSDTSLKSRRKLFDRRQNFEIDSSFQDAKTDVIIHFEKHYLNWLMNQSHGNVSQAAGISGKERRALGKLLKKHNINANQYRNRT